MGAASVSDMARKDITMTEEEIHEFLANGHTLQVATIGSDGFPHLAPMWYRFEGGKIVFRSFTKSQKVVNLMRNPNITVLVEDGKSYDQLRGVMIKGTATLITDRDYVLGLYGRVSADYEMVAGVRREFTSEEVEGMFGRIAEKNTAVVVEPVKVMSWDHTKLGGAY
jgi:PPOX class probable F420-dependent enzyme